MRSSLKFFKAGIPNAAAWRGPAEGDAMNEIMSRRQAIKNLTIAGLAGPAVLLLPGKARAYWNPIPYCFLGNGWDVNRRLLIGQAIWLVEQRFLNPAIAKNAHEQNGDYYYLTGQLGAATVQDAYAYAPDYAGVLWKQLSALRNAQSKPILYIEGQYRKDLGNIAAWASCDQVKIRFAKTGATLSLTGSFHIFLNTYLVSSNVSPFTDPSLWATVIAHEMLHCLGHMHENCTDYGYSWRQMITFHDAFYFNGRYIRGMKTPVTPSRVTPTNYCGCNLILP